MEQMNMDDLLFPKPKKIDNSKLFEEWLKTTTNDCKMLYFKHKWIYDTRYNFKKAIKEIEEIADSKTFHFGNLNKDIYIWSYSYIDDHWSYDKPKRVYFRAYQVRDRILVEYPTVDDFTDDIRFPAMEINMYDKDFNPIHFSNREDFIMEDLGFKEIGENIETFKKYERSFATVQVKFSELVEYLKR